MFLPASLCFLYNNNLQYRTPPTLPTSRNFKLKPTALYGAAFGLRFTNPLFYLTTISRHLLLAPSPHYRSHTVPVAHNNGGFATGNDKW